MIGNRICSRTTWMNVSVVIPSSRDCANASSRFGPIVPFVPASARVWQPPQALRKRSLPAAWLPLVEYPPVPQPASANAAAATAQAPPTSPRNVLECLPEYLTGGESNLAGWP